MYLMVNIDDLELTGMNDDEIIFMIFEFYLS